MNTNISPLNVAVMETWNKGRQAGKKEATDFIHAYLNERMESLTEIPGIGEKTALKVFEHFSEGIERDG